MRQTRSSRRRYVVDGGAAVALAVVAVASAALDRVDPSAGVTRRFDAAAVVFVLAMTLPLAVRRTYPRGAALFSVAASATGVALAYPVGIGPFGAVFALHSLAYMTTHRTAVLVGAPAGLVLLASLVAAPGSLNSTSVFGNGLFIVFALAAGMLLRIRNDQRTELVAQNLELNAAREGHIRSAVIEERMRIAREVHDAVGHTLVAITLQARAGQRRLKRDPDHTGDALCEIEALAQHALDETRTAVATIRTDPDQPAVAPRLTLADLAGLAESMRGPDLDIDLDVNLDGAHPYPEQERATYRIVQESLSNVAKHARPARARVVVVADGAALDIEVTNDGPCTASLVGGSGLHGMRERAELLGGNLVAGPTATGWRVRAHLPARREPSAVVA